MDSAALSTSSRVVEGAAVGKKGKRGGRKYSGR